MATTARLRGIKGWRLGDSKRREFGGRPRRNSNRACAWLQNRERSPARRADRGITHRGWRRCPDRWRKSSRCSEGSDRRRADSLGIKRGRRRKRTASDELSGRERHACNFRCDEFAAVKNSERVAYFQRSAFPRRLDQQVVRPRHGIGPNGSVQSDFRNGGARVTANEGRKIVSPERN